jgi:hypothetical protein
VALLKLGFLASERGTTMTLFGKILAVINLIVGIGMAMTGTLMYTQRPYYFEPPPEGSVDRGNTPVTFKEMTAEIDKLGKSAATATQNWGNSFKSVKSLEKVRKDRQAVYDARLQVGWQGPVKAGSPQDARAPGAAFFIDVYDDRTGLIDITQVLMDKKGVAIAIQGPDNQPLQGADTLMDLHATEVLLAAGDNKMKKGLLQEIKALREEQLKLQVEIVQAETRVLKQFKIREEVTQEVIFLKDFRINVGSNQETVYARKKQLEERLRQILPPKRN